MRRAAAGYFESVRISRRGNCRKMQLARKDVSGERGIQSCQIEFVERGSAHGYSVSAWMRMEMSAALAEWVSAPTLIKSTPVSA